MVNVLCADGSQVSYPLTLVGGSATPVQMQVNTPSSTYAPTPLIFEYDRKRLIITNLRFGTLPTGLTVLYQLQNRGAAYNNAGWSTAGSLGGGVYGPVPNFTSGQKTLYAKCLQTGSLDSPVVSWNL
jgi:hypothetical protein